MSHIGASVEYIEAALKAFHLNKRDLMEALLISEEVLALLSVHAPAGEKVTVAVFRRRGIPCVRLSAPGKEIDMSDPMVDLAAEQLGEETEEVIRGIMVSSFTDSIKYRYTRTGNTVTIITGIPERVLAVNTGIALIGAAILGGLLRLLMPGEWLQLLLNNFFKPVEQLFVSCLMLIAAPAIFFSVITSMIRFKGLSGIGSGGKIVVGTYLGTSVIAVLVGLSVFRLIDPGRLGMLSMTGNGVVSESFSLLRIIEGLIPGNIIAPFFNVNSLQVMVMGVVIGLAINLCGNRVVYVKKFFEEMDTVCSSISSMIMSLVPFVVFCTSMSVILGARTEVFAAALELVLVLLVSVLLVALTQILLLVVTTRLNPVTFLRKYFPVMKKTFLKGSGVAAIPVTIRACRRQFGISRRISSVTIPLGATINMDGNCVSLIVITLFLCKLYGVYMTGGELALLIVLVVMLSMGAPIAPGTIILCVVTLLNQMEITLDAISLIIGINFVLEMLLGVVNSLGDVVVALIVAKHEGELDEAVFKKI